MLRGGELRGFTMERNYIGNYAPSMTYQWTKQAVECYQLNCDCILCNIPQQMHSQKCQMKAVVLELIKNVGLPTKENCRNWSFYGYGRKRTDTKRA